MQTNNHKFTDCDSNETIWATQKAMAELFGVGIPAVSKHLKNIFEDGELDENSVISKMETSAADGKIYNTQAVMQYSTMPVRFLPNLPSSSQNQSLRNTG